MSSAKILVVDDEPQIRRLMKITLTESGYQVFEARSGQEALEEFRAHLPDLVLLDLNMSGMNGLEVCRKLRMNSDAPVIVLTVRNSEDDKVEALDAGADDYITKPFGILELLARIRAALRRAPTSPEGGPRLYSANGLEVDFKARHVSVSGKAIRLTPKEFELLRYLISKEGHPVPHRELLQAVWGPDYGDQGDYLRVFINHLRKKIEPDSSDPKYILTEPWFGYRFAMQKSADSGIGNDLQNGKLDQ
jgi:two-component system, OmpR family, KDP operon response regulator KdpE